jgi:transposase
MVFFTIACRGRAVVVQSAGCEEVPDGRSRPQPTFTAEQIALCERTARQHSTPQARVYRARLALLHVAPALDKEAAGRRLGKHANWVYSWRRIWAVAGFRLTDRPGRGRKPAFPPQATAPVKALACELPGQRDAPLCRHSTADLVRAIGTYPERSAMRSRTI